MTPDEIISMAHEAFSSHPDYDGSPLEGEELKGMKRFAALVVSREREECSRLIEIVRDDFVRADLNTKACAADYLIETIRERCNKS